MSFNQNSFIADLGVVREDAPLIINRHASLRKLTLILPATLQDATSDVMKKKILPVIRKAPYLSQVILGLDQCPTRELFEKVRRQFSPIPNTTILWNDAPEMKRLKKELLRKGYNIIPGKGLNVWLMLNYWYATTQTTNVIMHDCDIITYDERFLTSLALPIVDPTMDYDFVKLYYERITPTPEGEKLAGRVVRLLLIPLLDALRTVYGYDLRVARNYLDYLGMYKYALSGEFGMSRRLAARFPIHPDWALEIGTLSFLFNNAFRTCQVDVGRYDHKHSSLSPDDKRKGLHKMAIDITKAIFRKLYNFGVLGIMNEDRFRVLLDYYKRNAERLISIYRDRSTATGLVYSSVEEAAAVTTFGKSIREAYEEFRKKPMAIKPLPSPHDTDSRVQQQLVRIAYKYNHKPY